METKDITRVTIEIILNAEKAKSVLQMCRVIDSTYAHAMKITRKLEGLGYIRIGKVGRRNVMNLTDKGQQLRTAFLLIRTL